MEDILFETNEMIFDLPFIILGGEITGYSMDGNNFDFEQDQIIKTDIETSHIFIT
jgi:hypothetical protein